MFIGHFAAGFAGKAASPRTSLGALFLAAQFVDLLWPTLLLLGIEHAAIAPGITAVTPLDFTDYPITHSLLMSIVWSVLLAGIIWLKNRDVRAALVIGAAVMSHWLLDFITHRPDLPLIPGSEQHVGLNLWSSLPATLIVELALFGTGVFLYQRTTRATDKLGTWGLWSFVVFLLISYVINIFGPPPPNIRSVAWAGHAQWILVAWGYWVDRHRSAV